MPHHHFLACKTPIHHPSAEAALSSHPCLFQAKLVPVASVFLLQVRKPCVMVSENPTFLLRFSPRKLETDFKLETDSKRTISINHQHLPLPWDRLLLAKSFQNASSITLHFNMYNLNIFVCDNNTQRVSGHTRGFVQMRSSERSSDLTKVRELIHGRANIWTQICLLLKVLPCTAPFYHIERGRTPFLCCLPLNWQCIG